MSDARCYLAKQAHPAVLHSRERLLAQRAQARRGVDELVHGARFVRQRRDVRRAGLHVHPKRRIQQAHDLHRACRDVGALQDALHIVQIHHGAACTGAAARQQQPLLPAVCLGAQALRLHERVQRRRQDALPAESEAPSEVAGANVTHPGVAAAVREVRNVGRRPGVLVARLKDATQRHRRRHLRAAHLPRRQRQALLAGLVAVAPANTGQGRSDALQNARISPASRAHHMPPSRYTSHSVGSAPLRK